MFSLKALLLGCLHYLHVCYFFDPLLPQGMDIETLRRAIATVCLLWMSVGYSRKRLHTPRALYTPLYLIACSAHVVLALGNLARTPDVAIVIPLNNPAGPEGDTVTAEQCSPKP
jgi:hypothetical protein